MTKFVVLGSQRSGTVLLEDLLNSHPDAHCWGEVLLGMAGPTAAGYPAVLRRRRTLRHAWQYVFSGSATNPAGVLAKAFATPDVAAVGVRIMYNQLRARELRAVNRPDIDVVHVMRANTLRQFVSLNQMHSRQAELGPRTAHSTVRTTFAPVTLDADRALAFVRRREAEQRRFAALFARQTVLTLCYECDVLGRPQPPCSATHDASSESLSDRLTAALHLAPRQLGSALQKTGSDELRDSVSNYAEVARAFEATGYAWMLTS